MFVTAWLTALATNARARAASPAARRGVSILEYMLIALVILGVILIFRRQISSAFSDMIDRVTGGMDNQN